MARGSADLVPRHRYEREREARLRAERLLEQKALELYEAARTQERFLNNINHEFRTPMNGIIGPAQLLQAETNPDRIRTWGALIEESAQDLLRFLETAVTMARTNRFRDDTEEDQRTAPVVLIVDDNRVNRLVAKAAVEAVGMRSLQAGNGAEALTFLSEHDVDCVLMDLQMPVMDGRQAIRAIRTSAEGWARVPIIVLTANAELDAASNLTAMGATGYMTKPIAVPKLQRLLRELTASRPAPVTRTA